MRASGGIMQDRSSMTWPRHATLTAIGQSKQLGDTELISPATHLNQLYTSTKPFSIHSYVARSVRENVCINSKNVKNVRIVSEATNHSAFNYTITGSQYR